MSLRVTQCWPRRAVLAGALAVPLAGGLIPQQARAQYIYDYGYGYPGPAHSYSPQAYPGYPPYRSYNQRYYRGGDWGSGHRWQDRGWSGEDWGRGDRSDARRGHGNDRRRTDEGRSGSSGVRGTGAGKGQAGSAAGGNGGAYNSWLGSHGSYR
jgi:hypothetical protein